MNYKAELELCQDTFSKQTIENQRNRILIDIAESLNQIAGILQRKEDRDKVAKYWATGKESEKYS